MNWAETLQVCASSLIFSFRLCDVLARSSSLSPRTCNFARVARHFGINLLIFGVSDCHFRFHLAIFDLSIFVPVACHFHFDLVMFLLQTHHFRLDYANFDSGAFNFC